MQGLFIKLFILEGRWSYYKEYLIYKRCLAEDQRFKKVSAGTLTIQDQDGWEEKIRVDRLVWAIAAQSNNHLYNETIAQVRWLFLIGDASEVRGFAEAISEGEAVADCI